jgi:hypothetical protein
VDGTCEPGTDTVFNVVAGNRGWTLAGAKMSGEDVKQIAGLLRRCVESFGRPLALEENLQPSDPGQEENPSRKRNPSPPQTSRRDGDRNHPRQPLGSMSPKCDNSPAFRSHRACPGGAKDWTLPAGLQTCFAVLSSFWSTGLRAVDQKEDKTAKGVGETAFLVANPSLRWGKPSGGV